MSEWSGRRSLATLAILGCITILTAGAFVAVTYARWGWMSMVLGMVSMVPLVLSVRALLDALDAWLDRPDRSTTPEDRR